MSGRPRRAALLNAASALLLLGVLCAPAVPAHATDAGDATRAARTLRALQRPDGSYAVGATADGVAETMAVVHAAGLDGVDEAKRFIAARGAARAAERPAYAARIVLGLLATGDDPSRFAGFDYVEQVRARYDTVTGAYDDGVYANALAVLALAAAGEQIGERAITWFEANACRDGGFGHEAGCLQGADTDTTAVAIMALRRARVAAATVSDAADWLAGQVNGDGGYGARPGDPTNANSTGLAVSAIVSLGERPDAGRWRQGDGDDPVASLRALQLRSGAFVYQSGGDNPNAYATVQAAPALARRWYPVRSWSVRSASRTGSSPRASAGGRSATDVVGRSASVEPSREVPARAAASNDRFDVANASSPATRGAPGLVVVVAAFLLLASAGLLWRFR